MCLIGFFGGNITVDCTGGRLDLMSNAFIQMSGVFAELARVCNMSRTRVYRYMKVIKG